MDLIQNYIFSLSPLLLVLLMSALRKYSETKTGINTLILRIVSPFGKNKSAQCQFKTLINSNQQ